MAHLCRLILPFRQLDPPAVAGLTPTSGLVFRAVDRLRSGYPFAGNEALCRLSYNRM